MAEVINKNQQVFVAGTRPASNYSRVIGVNVTNLVVGVNRFASTPVVGNNVWLKKIQVWVFPKAIGVGPATLLSFRSGSTEPSTFADVLEWDPIIRNVGPGGVDLWWALFDGMNEMEFEFNQLFTGENRRFGIICARIVGGFDTLSVAFTFSEG